MKKLRRGVALAPAFCALAAIGTSEAASFGPELTFEARYDDNVLKQPSSLDDFVTVLVPRLRATEVEGVMPWELRLRRTLVSYSKDPSLVALSDLAMLRGAYYMAATESLSVGYRYTRSSEPVEVDEDAVVTGGDVFANSGHVAINSWRAEGSVRARSWSYQRAGLSDGHAQGWDFRYYPIRTRGTGWIVDYRGQNLDLDERGITAHVLTTGVRRMHATWISTEVEIGGAAIHYDDVGADDQKPAGAVGVVLERGEQAAPIRARFRLAQDVTTTSIAELQRSWEVARVTARWESSLDAEGGIYRSPTVSRRLSLGLLVSPDDVKRVALDASYRRVRQFRGESVDANILRFAAAYSTTLNSWLRARASYDYVRQEVPPGGRALEFTRNRVILSLTAGMPR